MDLYTIIDQIASLLQQRGRLAYRALQLQFHLNRTTEDSYTCSLSVGSYAVGLEPTP